MMVRAPSGIVLQVIANLKEWHQEDTNTLMVEELAPAKEALEDLQHQVDLKDLELRAYRKHVD